MYGIRRMLINHEGYFGMASHTHTHTLTILQFVFSCSLIETVMRFIQIAVS